jgi:hypothetical protein
MYFLKLAAVVFPALFGWATLGFAYAGPKAPPEFDITSFDATPNDDTDDAATIQACITAAEAEAPAIVYVPRGVFTIDTQLLIEADGITLRGEGTIQTKAGNTTMTSMIDVTGDDFVCEGISIDAASRGVAAGLGGHCLRVQGRNNRIRAVKCYDPTDTCFQIHTGSDGTKLDDCYANGGLLSARVNGDHVYIHGLRAEEFIGEKSIIVDPQIADAQFCVIEDCFFKTESANWECIVLVDTGDGGLVNNPDNTQQVEIGAATNVNGKAYYTIPAGNGYKAGDQFNIIDSGLDSDEWDRVHKVIRATGEVFARRLSATTFALYGTAAQARNTDSTTGRINLVDDGTQAIDFYCTTPLAGLMTIDEEAIDYTNDVLTTTETAPGFQTCEPVRITPHNRLHLLPGGIRDGGGILLNTAYIGAGSADTCYFPPKRLEQFVFLNNQIYTPNGMLNAANHVKCNNVNNALFVGSKLYSPQTVSVEEANGAGTADDEYYSLQSVRLGANVRKATFINMEMAAGILINPTSGVNELLVENCTLGSESLLNDYCVENFHVHKAIFRQTNFICSRAAIEYHMSDDELDSLEFDQCRLDARNATTAVKWLESSGVDEYLGDQLYAGGKIFFRKNNQATNWLWPGTVVTFVDTTGDAATVNDTATFRASDGVTATNHCLTTGDEIYFSGGTLPAGLTDTGPYYVRVTGNNTVYLYESRDAACSSSMTNEINFQDAGSGTILAVSPTGKLGINPTGSGVSNLLLRCGASPFDLEDVITGNATSTGLSLPLGTRIWNSNGNVGSTTTSTLTPGWVVTAEGVRGSSGATLGAMGTLTP